MSNVRECTGGFVDFTRSMGFEVYENGEQIPRMIKSVQEFEQTLTAEEAPRGCLSVVFEGGGCVGTFLHEACGHQLETTNMQSEDAYFRDKLGCKVDSEKVTLIDDGTICGLDDDPVYE